MIINVTLNPAIDKTYNISDFTIGSLNRIDYKNISIGGKGINSAQAIKILQGEPLVLGFLGGLNGKYIKNQLDKSKIKSDCIWTSGETRVNTIIIDKINNTRTNINDDMTAIGEREINMLIQKYNNYISKANVVVLSGSIPNDVNVDIYKDFIKTAKSKNVKVVLAADGETLKNAIDEVPYALKLNISQLKDLGINTENEETIMKDLIPYLKRGIHYIAVDLGKDGAIVMSKSKLCYAKNIDIDIVKHLRSSDAFLGALAVSIERKYEQEKFIKLCQATKLATQMHIGEDICNKSHIDMIMKKIKVREIANKSDGIITNKFIRFKKIR